MNRDFVFVTNCVSANGEDIREMIDHPSQRDITRKTFLQHVDYTNTLKEIEEAMGYVTGVNKGLHMASDWAVNYSRSFYKGSRCYYFTWSAIEYIFVSEAEEKIRYMVIENQPDCLPESDPIECSTRKEADQEAVRLARMLREDGYIVVGSARDGYEARRRNSQHDLGRVIEVQNV